MSALWNLAHGLESHDFTGPSLAALETQQGQHRRSFADQTVSKAQHAIFQVSNPLDPGNWKLGNSGDQKGTILMALYLVWKLETRKLEIG